MKINVYLTLFAVLCLAGASAQTPAGAHQFGPSTDPAWFAKASAWIDQLQSDFKPMGADRFAAVNSGQHLGFLVQPGGYSVKPVSGDQSPWTASFALNNVNGKPWKDLSSQPLFTHQKDSLHVRFNGVSVEYTNRKEGFRQNFVIDRKDDKAARLSVCLSITTDLNVVLDQRNGLLLKTAGGKTQLAYDDLNVWDAQHTRLPAHMTLKGKELTIVVDDRNAVYPVTIDPLNHAYDWHDHGDGLVLPLLNDLATPVLYGFSISNAGDLNGDGYGDVVVGAPTYVDVINVSAGTFNIASVGAAFVYYGSASGLASTPNEILQPTTQAGALFGFSVSKAGDINGDGKADLVIGAPGDRITLNVGVVPVATSVAAGKVYVYYGGSAGTFDGNVNTEPTVSATISLTQSDFGALLSVPVNPLFGYSVADAGDVNGDGKQDVIVGSPAFTRLLPTPVLGGRVDIFNGSAAGIATTPSATITGSLTNALFGFSVSTAGNVNADMNGARPISDIIVGAPGDLTFLGVGKAYVFKGSTSGITATNTSQADATLSSGGLLTTLFGFSVSNAGDVNGDGYDDVIVGEPAALETLLTQTASVGAAHIFYGSSTGTTTTGFTTLRSPRRPSVLGLVQGNLLFGFSVSAAGDVDCDGKQDVVVGEPGGTALSLGTGLLSVVSTNVLSGSSYVFSGRAGGPQATPTYTLQENGAVSAANLIGYSVSEGGDINGDGKADLLVGAPNGTLNLSGSIIPAVGNLLSIVFTNSIGNAYGFFGCLQGNTVLPVTVSSFTGQKDGERVRLDWRTSAETHISHYIVERSTDASSFSSIGVVFAGGENYRFADNDPAAVNYYRLKIMSDDGSSRYSNVVTVRFAQNRLTAISVYPNPVSTQYEMTFNGVTPGAYELRVTNPMGQVQQRKRIAVSSDSGNISMKRDGLAAGVYFLGIYDASGHCAATTRITVQ